MMVFGFSTERCSHCSRPETNKLWLPLDLFSVLTDLTAKKAIVRNIIAIFVEFRIWIDSTGRC